MYNIYFVSCIGIYNTSFVYKHVNSPVTFCYFRNKTITFVLPEVSLCVINIDTVLLTPRESTME